MITIVLGPMYSGKTSMILHRLERAYIAKQKVILLRPNIDNRGFLTHTGQKLDWLEEKFVDLDGLDVNKYDVIGLDEAQFFIGLKDFCMKYSNKNIFISALHATSESEMFLPIIELIPYCENIIKLNAVCTECGSEYGNYTYYKTGRKTEKVKVGGSDEYTALCFNCYKKMI